MKRILNNTLRGFGLLLIAFSLSSAYTYSAWTSMTGAKTVAINPFVQTSFDEIDQVSTDLVAGYGFTDQFDLYVNIATLSPIKEFSYAGSWVMPRYALSENKIIALQLGTDKENLTLSPQFHAFRDNGPFVLEFNAGLSTNSSDFAAGSLFATFGLVYKLSEEIMYPFIEVNPSYQYGGEEGVFDFTVDPGVWYGLKGTPHQIALSLPFSGIKDNAVSVGLHFWYWWSFGGK